MLKISLKTQLLSSILIVLLLSMGVLFYFSYNNFKEKVNNSQAHVYNQKIDNILFLIEQKYNILKKTGMEVAFKESFQEGTIKVLKEIFYKNELDSSLLPFVISDEKEYLLHGKYKQKNKKLYEKEKNYLTVLELKEGDITLMHNKKDIWIIFKHFKQWDWIIGFEVPTSLKYKELYAYRNEFLITLLIILVLISLSIITIVRYILKPIDSLSKVSKEIASGNLDTPIAIYGSIELSILAKNFIIMRDKIKTSIKELEHHNIILEDKVKYRTTELEKSYKELEQILENLNLTQEKLIESEKMASLGGLVAGVAHEINTPIGIGITAITHFIEMNKNIIKLYDKNEMSQEEFEDFLKTSKELAQMIFVNLNKTATLIKSFKQVSVDQISEDKRCFNLKEYINDTLLSISNITKKTEIDIRVEGNSDIMLNSYPGAFSQVISNLVINSIRHAYGIKDKGCILINIESKNKNLIINYKDDGKGIKKEHLSKIFNPFFTTNRESGGTGLGLNIIYNIINNNLKGKITCVSEEGKGVLFKIIIPLSL
ncbi:MAG: HAMP domain-containing protein [Campylobacteraceae bacterium]|nr:HAMP domain-containing protein [Campylobacteraceae bacterium]